MKRHLHRIIPLLILALVLVLRVVDPAPIEQIRLLVFDTYQRLQPRIYDPRLPVRIIDIDDDSLARLGQWPWPRTVLARIVGRLSDMGAAVIAFDVVFAEPDRVSPDQVLRHWPTSPEIEALRRSSRNLPSHDRLFGQAIARARVVTGFVLTHNATPRRPAAKGTFAHAGDDPKPFIPAFSSAVINLPELERPAQGNGSLNFLPGSDQIIRRAPLVFRIGDTLYPSLAAEALRVAQGAKSYLIKSSGASGETAFGQHTGLNSIRIGQFIVPTDANGQTLMYYTGAQPGRSIPAWQILQDDFDADRVAGQIVLVGTSAAGLLDLRATPLNPATPGVEVHAQLIEQILAGDFLQRPDYAFGVELVYMLVLGLLLVVLLPLVGAWWSFAVGALASTAAIGTSWFAFTGAGWLFDPVFPTVRVFVVFLSATIISYLRSESEKRQVRDAFGRFLSPVMVERLAEHPEELKLGGEERNMSVMFSDIRGFTALAERFKDDPQGLTTLINRFLTPMTDEVLAFGGTIDKYIGDCLMGFWNAPLDDEHHAKNACHAALAMLQALDRLNAELAAESRTGGGAAAATAGNDGGAAGEGDAPADSFEHLKLRAEQGSARAQYMLGKAWRDGNGVAADMVEAARWFLLSAEQDYAKAQRHIGNRYAHGEGVTQDAVAAIMWLNLAAGHGLVTAEASLDEVLRSASPEDRNEAERHIRTWQPRTDANSVIRFAMGIGISTGNCVVGNMGSTTRFDYSLLGDPVNLAARLEGQTKNYGVGIIIGEGTRELAPEFAALELDLIAVKGRREAVRIYGLLGAREMAESEEFNVLSERHRQMLAEYRAQRWQAARDLIEDCAGRDGSLEKLYDVYRDRIGQYEQDPPGSNWDGVYVALTK